MSVSFRFDLGQWQFAVPGHYDESSRKKVYIIFAGNIMFNNFGDFSGRRVNKSG
jgi:hypothetical protein